MGARRRSLGGALGRSAGTGDGSDEAGQRGAGSEARHVPRGPNGPGSFGKIFRRNIGYGTLTRHGTIFVGFSQEQGRLDAMLRSMCDGPCGGRDRLTHVTRALSGAYYFVPSIEALAAFAATDAA